MFKFIERLFIKRNQKVHENILKHCDRVNRYVVCDLWSTKIYFTMPEYELTDYTEIWNQTHIKWFTRGWLVLIK